MEDLHLLKIKKVVIVDDKTMRKIEILKALKSILPMLIFIGFYIAICLLFILWHYREYSLLFLDIAYLFLTGPLMVWTEDIINKKIRKIINEAQ